MTKAELISRVSEKTGIRREEVEKIIESLFLTIKDSMSNGDNIYFRGFGSFVNKQRAAKTARNIKLKATVLVPAQIIPYFKPSDEFVSQVKDANFDA
ncbi:DNA-binding protein HU-beta [Dyadobacter koreensis]|uniref:DNA-binding protein HU-beta n=1 Tax=Dyadobacter koreensis TaxID=408657 RepID=A0A1H6QE62_9BACT|nr:HU family DNA-binding protein [Dyadobacter koreensis]SEI37535.1 DNA-binding protein HU-beta [Dyadobacter koreensis]